MAEKVVVAGAGFGGITAAIELARKGFEVKIIDQNGFHEYKPGLIDIFRNRVKQETLKLNISDFFDKTPVDFSREKILGFDLERNTVETSSGSHSYDYLVLALGARPATYGMDISKVEKCYNLRQAKKLDERLDEADDVTIVGSGYVGIEVATEIGEREKDVTVIDADTRPCSRSGFETSEVVLDYMNNNDIDFRGGTKVAELDESSVTLETGEEIESDLVVWAGGIQASEVVQDSFDTEPCGLPVNSGLSSKEHENVFAIGDNADSGFKDLAQNAEKQADIVAENITKTKAEALEEYEEGTLPLIISMGDTAILSYGDRTYKNRLFRKLKDLVRIRYLVNLKSRKLKLRLGL
jgi:NADH dehydrogenase